MMLCAVQSKRASNDYLLITYHFPGKVQNMWWFSFNLQRLQLKYIYSQSVLFRFLFADYIRWPGMFYDCNDLHLFSFSRWKWNGWVTLHKLPNMYHWIVIMNKTSHYSYANGCATASPRPHTRFTLSHLVMATAATKPAKCHNRVSSLSGDNVFHVQWVTEVTFSLFEQFGGRGPPLQWPVSPNPQLAVSWWTCFNCSHVMCLFDCSPLVEECCT